MRLFPAKPLLVAARFLAEEASDVRIEERPSTVGYAGAQNVDYASVFGVDRRTINRWRAGVMLTFWQADQYAIRIGLHPTLVWPDWLDTPDVECSYTECDERFLPSYAPADLTKRFCSRRCRDMHNRDVTRSQSQGEAA